MESDIQRAMARWPKVPAVSGWLRLDRRGQWWLRNNRVTHPNSLAFIAANYEADPQGRYFFQNGPQRVYAELELTPYIYRYASGGHLSLHTGQKVTQLIRVLTDERDNLYLETEYGIGVVHDQDLELLSEAMEEQEDQLLFHFEANRFPIHPIEADRLPQEYGFVRKPEA